MYEQEFRYTLSCLRKHLVGEKNALRITKKLIRMCKKMYPISSKRAYMRRLQASLSNYEKKIVELTRAIGILNH